MGFNTNRHTILLLFLISVMISSFGESINVNDSSRNSLDGLLHGYAEKAIIHTGPVYNVTLPTNLSGAEASVVRLRTGKFWVSGTNLSNVLLPRRILPVPFVKRLDIVYVNLGNLSSTYFNVSGYTMITPVVGFMFYDDTNTSATANVTRLNITVMEEPISIRFPKVELPQGSKCVRFGDNGLIEFSEIALDDKMCLTRDQGYFAVVIPATETEKKVVRIWKWLIVGFALGFASLVLCGVVGILVYKCVKTRKMAEMEKRADEGESFENVWIGSSRMPSATVARTKPVLEHNEVP